jgi:hypothetical protein
MSRQEQQAAYRQKMLDIFGTESLVGSPEWKAKKQAVMDDYLTQRDLILIKRAQSLKATFERFRLSPTESRPDGKLD